MKNQLLELLLNNLSTPIEKLNLTPEIYDALKLANVHTLADIVSLGETGLLKLPNINLKELDIIQLQISKYLEDLLIHLPNTPLKSENLLENSISVLVANILQSIFALNLSSKIVDILREAQIRTIGKLLQVYFEDLSVIYGLGPKSLSEIRESLLKFLNYGTGDSSLIAWQENLPQNISKLPISVIPLSTKALKQLKKNKINTIADLLLSYSQGFKETKNLKIKILAEIDKVIYEVYNLSPEIVDFPISILDLSVISMKALEQAEINTIGRLIKARSYDLNQIEGLGPVLIDEIEKNLSKTLQDFGESLPSLTEVKQAINSPSYLVVIDNSNCPNLVKLIVSFMKAVLRNERSIKVLQKRFNLDGQGEYTCQEVGDYYDLTRERIRQIEVEAIKMVQRMLLTDFSSRSNLVQESILVETENLIKQIQSMGQLVVEQEIIELVAERYQIELMIQDIYALRFLLQVFNFRPLPSKIINLNREIERAWIIDDSLNTRMLFETLQFIYREIRTATTGVSLFDLKIKINRRRKNKISTDYIIMGIKISPQVETINTDTFRLKFEYLPSLADQAYRILHELAKPTHMRDISREINHRLVKSGFSSISFSNLQNQMVSDSRFEPIGSSGIWSLAEWKGVSKKTIVELIVEFFHLHQSSATAREVYAYVQTKRENIAKNSIPSYLSMNNQFVRVSKGKYELVTWGGKPYQADERTKPAEVQKRFINAVETIFSKQEDKIIPLNELLQLLADQTGLAQVTLRGKIEKTPLLRVEKHPTYKQRKIVRYIGSEKSNDNIIKTQKKKTMREITHQEVEKYLKRQPNYKATVANLAKYIVALVGCKKHTFYVYLSEMEKTNQIRKETLDGNLYCYLEIDEPESIQSLSFPQINQITDNTLKQNLQKAVNLLNIETVDLGLFQLGKLFENELKAFLLMAQQKNTYPITKRDLNRLVDMINCVERHKIIRKKHHLTLLREHRNERAHGQIPNLEERKRLMQHTPFLADLYIEYIIRFHEEKSKLITHH